MTKVRGSEMSDLDTGEAGDGRNDTPMDVVMEMAMIATPIAAKTVGTTIFEPMERNDNGRWDSGSEALEGPHGASDSAGCPQNSTATLNCRKDGKHVGRAISTSGGVVARVEHVAGENRGKVGRVPPG